MARHTSPRRAGACAAVLLTLPFALGACGSSKKSSAADTTTTAGPASTTAAVAIKDYAFGPKSITVKAGGTVTWTNSDDFEHAIQDKASGQSGNDSIAPKGGTYSHTYPTAGEFPYVCGIHVSMTGTVVVVP